jgi:hypothetical protein
MDVEGHLARVADIELKKQEHQQEREDQQLPETEHPTD